MLTIFILVVLVAAACVVINDYWKQKRHPVALEKEQEWRTTALLFLLTIACGCWAVANWDGFSPPPQLTRGRILVDIVDALFPNKFQQAVCLLVSVVSGTVGLSHLPAPGVGLRSRTRLKHAERQRRTPLPSTNSPSANRKFAERWKGKRRKPVR